MTYRIVLSKGRKVFQMGPRIPLPRGPRQAKDQKRQAQMAALIRDPKFYIALQKQGRSEAEMLHFFDQLSEPEKQKLNQGLRDIIKKEGDETEAKKRKRLHRKDFKPLRRKQS